SDMLPASCSILLILGRTSGDSVAQTEGLAILTEGAPLTLNCTYQSNHAFFILWYIQYISEAPQLLKSSMEDNKGFEATYNKEATSFHLKKASVQVSDSAVYYCALGDTVAETAGGAEHKL
uniref:Ig-like domain-containing protein n=1 Tax=Sciurus vulgaris TaxID=55149 RepID=A0A8D2AH30_SCIVU